ncbi:MAG: beta-ketoacyl-[acyl-carrier-protein] synthase family protein [Paracoccaceae bacterium]|nr:beta-ketoacyl-[acyl-carrier-protein] synthase family protein [Paracoccaceae bacterium]
MYRVAITGQGTINCLGRSVPETVAAMAEGRCGIGDLDILLRDRLSVRIGGQVRDFDPADHFERQQRSLYDRSVQFAIVAATEALNQSGLDISEALSPEVGVVLGSGCGGIQTLDQSYEALYGQGKNRVHPLVIPRSMTNAASSHVSMAWNLQGPCYSVSTACASSNHAMGQAFQLVRTGQARVMVTGGAESMLCFGGIKAWEGLRVMSRDGCRPFCRTRNGMVQGEGAAVFVFEEFGHAESRGAEILAEVVGFGMTADASDIVLPDPKGAARAIAGALRDAGTDSGSVGYINAHGTGTTANDRSECVAVRLALGVAAETVMMSSTKSMHGHLIGGAGAVELLACIAAVRDGIIAPTVGYRAPDPECDLDVVPNTARQHPVRVALSNAFAFGGLNAVLAIRSV